MVDDGKAGALADEAQGLAVREQPSGGQGAEEPGGVQGLNELTQRRLGLHLRTMYDAIVQQPVPDRFRELIEKLDARDG